MGSTALVATLVLGLTSTAALAKTKAKEKPKEDATVVRASKQNDQIRHAYASGQLTLKEAKELRSEQRNIRDAIREAKKDGTISKSERDQIKSLQDIAKARIYLQKTDKEKGGVKDRASVRQFSQRERIKDGLSNGQLTSEEAKALNAYLDKNKELISKLRKNGLDDAEIGRVNARQDIADAKIRLERIDGERAPSSISAAAPASVTPIPVYTTPSVLDPMAINPVTMTPSSVMPDYTAGSAR